MYVKYQKLMFKMDVREINKKSYSLREDGYGVFKNNNNLL